MNNYIERLALVLGALITSLTILSASADEREIIGIPISETDESSEARLLSAFFGLDNNCRLEAIFCVWVHQGKMGCPLFSLTP